MKFEPQTKRDILKAAAAAGNWQLALRIASKFGELGEHKAAIVRGHEAHTNGSFAQQLGRDPAADIEAGIAALCARYSLNRDGTEAVRTYTARKNCIRAARKVLGADAQEGADFVIAETAAGFGWAVPAPVAPVAPPALIVAPAPAAAPAVAAPAVRGRYADMAEAARKGVMPAVPDFSAPTHKASRGKLANLVALAEAGDLDGLTGFAIKPYDSSMKALARYRDMAVAAIATKA